MGNDCIYKMKFAKAYQMLLGKAEPKGRTKEEVDIVTGGK